MRGIDLLKMAYDGELKPKTIVETAHEKQYFDDREKDYYIYQKDNMFHRCNEEGKLGSKYQDRFLNPKILEKKFNIVKILEEDSEYIDYIYTSGRYFFSSIQNGMTKEDRKQLDSYFRALMLSYDVMARKVNELIEKVNASEQL